MSERFGHIIIDSPQAQGGGRTAPEAVSAASAPAPALWPRLSTDARSERYSRLRRSLAPAEGESYRLLRMDELCGLLGIDIAAAGGRRRDRELLARLGYELARLDLRMARSIIGKAIPKADETVPLYDSAHGEPPKRGTLPVGMFLAAWLVGADGATARDLQLIDRWIADSSDTDPVPAIATMRWLTSRRLILTSWRKARCASLSRFVHRRASLVGLLLALVADGSAVSPARMARLHTIYSLIGLDPAAIHSDLHRMATSEAAEPGRGRTASATAMDRGRLSRMSADTARAQALLADVFGPDEPEAGVSNGCTPVAPAANGHTSSDRESPTLLLVRALSAKAEWSLDEFRTLCTDRRETPASMLERLNDLSYDSVGEPLAEEDGKRVLIDLDVARQILDSA